MTTHLVFCHGFGFDVHFWHRLAPCFDNQLKCSFFRGNGIISQEKVSNRVGIGHSLGFLKLIRLHQMGVAFKSIIGLQAFNTFLGNGESLRQKRTREMTFMRRSFIENPIKAMTSFYTRSGIDNSYQQTLLTTINSQETIADFDLLETTVRLPKEIPILIVGANDDVIVPKELIMDNFSKNKNVTIQFLEKGQHQLGYTQEDLISQIVKGFINA
jgi:pimeloyl-[acyl-carrier protein] methyl ester esterase